MNAPAALKPQVVRCAVYTRKSSEEGLDQDFNSLQAQREACEAYILSQVGEGWAALPQAYDDGGISGGTMERPALKRLLAEVEAGRVDTVVVYKIDRLTRSLGDFARIVEIFDKAGASFVSVTQAFNTTTSMGRLTLNVLLSFAQFEREVTGERIRDKIAASKKKGMWMGGNIPLGYDPDGRTLKVNAAEAQIVRHIFNRYLQLGSVHRLRDELEAQGVRSKQWTGKNGRVRGGTAIARGALFHILSNGLYIGLIPHKGEYHPGQHAALIDVALFEQVQAGLARQAGAKRRAQSGLSPLSPSAPLSGLIYDDKGNRMSPSSTRKGAGKLYRYYVSAAQQQGRTGQAGSLGRAPAGPLEDLVLQRAATLGLVPGSAEVSDIWPAVRATLGRVEVSRGAVTIFVRRSALGADDQSLAHRLAQLPGDQVDLTPQIVSIRVSIALSRRGHGKLLLGPHGGPALEKPQVDRALLRALVQAEAWKNRLLRRKALTVKEIAKSEGVRPSHCERIIRLAFLAPDLKRAILEGRAADGLMLERLKQSGVPDDWIEQRRVLASARRP